MDQNTTEVSLDRNEACLVDNPLKDKPLEQLDEEATNFANRVGAPPSLFKKGARIAQDPPNWPSVGKQLGLSRLEKHALTKERTVGFWGQPKSLKVTVATLCFSAVIQGWIQTGLNGANQTWPEEFGLTNSTDGAWVDTKSKWIFAAVNAITFLAASVFGCWLSDPLQSAYLPLTRKDGTPIAVLGRRGAIFASGCLCLAALIGSACCHTWQQLLGCRAVLGIGMGAKASITPIYGAEVSPSHLRGALVMNWQLFDTCGIFLGFTANLIVYRIGPLSWRFQIASACLPTICLLTLIWVIPESPRWLLKQGRLMEAYQSMCALRDTPLQAAREIFYANAQLQIEVSLIPSKVADEEEAQMQGTVEYVEDINALHRSRTDMTDRTNKTDPQLDAFQKKVRLTNYWERIWQLFHNKRTRRATLAAGVVMISQQLCGINVLAFYSSTFFRDAEGAGTGGYRAVWLSWGFGLANFVFTFPAFYLIESPDGRPGGRRFLLLATYPGMTIAMLAACLSFLNSDPSARIVLIGFFLFVFVLFYALGQGPVAFAYSSEVFPLVYREAGMSFAVFINFFGAGLLTLFVPLAQTTNSSLSHASYAVGQTRLLAVFVGFNIVAVTLIFLFVPETAIAVIPRDDEQLISLSLEELNWIFGVPTFKHTYYQIFEMLPWGLRQFRWLLFDRFRGLPGPKRPEKLYRWAQKRAMQKEKKDSSATPIAYSTSIPEHQMLGFSNIRAMNGLQDDHTGSRS